MWSLETQTTKQTQQLHTELGGVQELLQLGIFTISRHIELGGVQELSQLDSHTQRTHTGGHQITHHDKILGSELQWDLLAILPTDDIKM